MKALLIPFLTIMAALIFAAGPASAQVGFQPFPNMWSAPAQAGQQATQLENSGLPVFRLGNSFYFYAGNGNYLRRYIAGGGPGVGGDSGFSVLSKLP